MSAWPLRLASAAAQRLPRAGSPPLGELLVLPKPSTNSGTEQPLRSPRPPPYWVCATTRLRRPCPRTCPYTLGGTAPHPENKVQTWAPRLQHLTLLSLRVLWRPGGRLSSSGAHGPCTPPWGLLPADTCWHTVTCRAGPNKHFRCRNSRSPSCPVKTQRVTQQIRAQAQRTDNQPQPGARGAGRFPGRGLGVRRAPRPTPQGPAEPRRAEVGGAALRGRPLAAAGPAPVALRNQPQE